MKRGPWLLVVLLGLWWALSGCQRQGPLGEATATATPRATPGRVITPSPTASPTATATPTITPSPTPSPTPTPLPTPTMPPQAVGAEDPANDGIYCTTGRTALFLLPPAIDLFYAYMERITRDGQCYLRVVIFFREPLGETRVRGGVIFAHESLPTLSRPSRTWYFDNVGSISFNFEWRGEGRRPLRLWVDRVQGRGWSIVVVPGYTGQVTPDGALVLEIPCRFVPEGSRWMVGVADRLGKKCDALGLEADRPKLPLPP